MISFTVCKKCKECEFHDPSYDESGEMEVCPYVKCAKAETVILLMNCEPPRDCPYAMEHAMFTQAETKRFADWMSGGASRNARKMKDSTEKEE
jgi:hypothetical protein